MKRILISSILLLNFICAFGQISQIRYWQLMDTLPDHYLVTGPDGKFKAEPIPSASVIDTLADYAALAAYSGTSNTVIVKNPVYGGVFYQVDSGTELDGGTVFLAANGEKYKRLVDNEGLYILEWFQPGNYSPENDINNVIVSGSDQFNAAILAANSGGNRTILTTKGGVYDIDRDIAIKDAGITFLSTSQDTLRRADNVTSTLTVAAIPTDNTITVADGSVFREGIEIYILDLSATNGGAGDNENNGSARTITNISGNVLTVNGTIGGAINFDIGDRVVSVAHIFTHVTSQKSGMVKWENLVFDGNRANNDHIHDWGSNNTFNVLNSNSHYVVENCGFMNTPSENMQGASFIVSDSWFYNMGGSIVHLSGVPENKMVTLERCWIDSTNIIPSSITGHSEAMIVTSGAPRNMRVSNITAANIMNETIFGDAGAAMDDWYIDQCKFRNAPAILNGGVSTEDEGMASFRVTNSVFVNCGGIEWTGGNVTEGENAEFFELSNSTIINGWVDIGANVLTKIVDTDILYLPGYDGFTGYTASYSPPNLAAIYVENYDILRIDGNRLLADTSETENTYLQHGILMHSREHRADNETDGSISNIYYSSHVLITGNQLLGFPRGITTFVPDSNNPLLSSNIANNSRIHDDVIVKDNHIVMMRDHDGDVANKWGILGDVGVDVMSNHVVGSYDTISTTYWPIFIYGVRNSGGVQSLRAITECAYNKIEDAWNFAGTTESIRAGEGVANNNIFVHNNTIPTAVTGAAVGDGECVIQLNNIINTLFSHIEPDFPPIRWWEYRKDLY